MSTTVPQAPADLVAGAYDALADHYDLLTGGHDHETWLGRLEQLAREHGLRGRRLLDVACGTGKSFMPLLRRGYEVVGSDISPAMLDIARRRGGDGVELVCADVRELPPLGPFDLVTWLDDAVNYLLGDDDLALALRSIERVLADDGLLVFDANTLVSHRDVYTSTYVVDDDGAFLCWHAQSIDEERPGLLGVGLIEIFDRAGPSWVRRRSEHRQRWWGEHDVSAACDAAGLELVAVRGQHRGAILDRHADEDVHNKIVYLARRRRRGPGHEEVQPC